MSSLLRAAVNERLAAAAEEIFMLLERTIAEYEEEVCRSKEENQRNQQLLEALRPRVLLHRTEDTESDLRVKTEPEPLSITPELHHRPTVTPVLCVKVKETEELVRDDTTAEEWTEPLEAPPEAQDQDCFGFTEAQSSLNFPHRGVCWICGKTLKKDLWRHILLHRSEPLFSCSICHQSFSRRSLLSAHMGHHLTEKPYRCGICNQRFSHRSALKTHKDTHSCHPQDTDTHSFHPQDTDTHSCHPQNTDTHSFHLQDTDTHSCHLQDTDTHSCHLQDTDTHSCHTQDTDTHSCHLQDTDTHSCHTQDTDTHSCHLQDTDTHPERMIAITAAAETKTKERRAQSCRQLSEETGPEPRRRKKECLVDQTHASQPAAKEQRTERGECAVCGKVFNDLWRHMLIHTGERPYSCSVCRKGFTRKSSLTLHRALHMKEKPFTCQVCGRGFTQNNNLKVHLGTHAREQRRSQPPGDRLHLERYFHTQDPNSVPTSSAP